MKRVMAAMAAAAVLAACGGGVTGTYSNGNGVLELKGGGKASLTIDGEKAECSYTATKEAVSLSCMDEKAVQIIRNGDGSLSAPFIGVLMKQ